MAKRELIPARQGLPDVPLWEMSRENALTFCKRRAMGSLPPNGSIRDAFMSMYADMGEHPELKNHTFRCVLLQSVCSIEEEAENFINGFN
jgi:hypothetical protein